MTLIYPRQIPAFVKMTSGKFQLMEQVSTVRSRGGGVVPTENAEPYWKFSITTIPLWPRDADPLQSWWESLGGGRKTFLATDMRRNFPLAYQGGISALVRSGGGAFDGTAKLVSAVAGVISFGAAGGLLPSGFALKDGDKIGLVSSGATVRYSVHRVIEDAVASAGGIITANIYPFVAPGVFVAGDTVNTVRPMAEFVPDKESWIYDSSYSSSPVSFSGMSKVF